jgi:hypothetical protein
MDGGGGDEEAKGETRKFGCKNGEDKKIDGKEME